MSIATGHTNLVQELRSLQQEFGLIRFVETGTGRGTTLLHIAEHFESALSCEIRPEAAKKARHRLRGCSNVHIFNALSSEFLPMVCRGAQDVPTMWWLDAHWSGGKKLASECPLLQELEIIGGTYGQSVILIDDLNYMLQPPPHPHDHSQWPTYAAIKRQLDTWGERLDERIVQGPKTQVLVITPGKSK